MAIVVGTRQEIVKLAPLARRMGTAGRLLHTCQHEDEELSGVFLAAAGIRQAQTLAGICGAPRHAQVGRIIEQLGVMFCAGPPAAVVVQGDTNTASAAAQAASYAGVPIVHVEAGLRSYDRAMPEEINRCVTAVLADLHCAPTPRAVANLRDEGVPAAKIELTGNTIGDLGRQLISAAGLADRPAHIPCPFGDGKATERIAACLRRFLG